MVKKTNWVKLPNDYEPNTNFEYKVIAGEIDGKLFRVSQMAPDAWKLEIDSKPILYNVPKMELVAKFPELRRAMKEVKSGLAASKKKEKFGL